MLEHYEYSAYRRTWLGPWDMRVSDFRDLRFSFSSDLYASFGYGASRQGFPIFMDGFFSSVGSKDQRFGKGGLWSACIVPGL